MSSKARLLSSVGGGVGAGLPDPEVSVLARRRQFTAQEKLALLEEAERCRAAGTLGAFLRRHGLYSSHLAKWRQQRAGGGLAGLAPKKRGPAPKVTAEQRRIRELEAKLARVERELATAQIIIDVQKKVAALVEAASKPTPSDERKR
jgi:transposase